MTLLAIDLGSTHLKAGIFSKNGQLLGAASCDHHLHPDQWGGQVYHPQELIHSALTIIEQALAMAEARQQTPIALAGIGIASMAESGLLVELSTGSPRTAILPWFDPRPQPHAQRLIQDDGARQRFPSRGIRPTFKCSLAKLMWLQEQQPQGVNGARWLGAAEYLAFCLTGEMFTDYSLAGRTYAFRIDEMEWDQDLLQDLGLPVDIFPEALPSGQVIGRVLPSLLEGKRSAKETSQFAHSRLLHDFPRCSRHLPGAPVVIAGHDHICGALAAAVQSGGVSPNLVFDSIGTAESLIGVFTERLLTQADYRAGFSYGIFPEPGYLYWMGGLSTSGGSLEWLRTILGDPPLTYAEIEYLMAGQPGELGDLLYYPYLAGRGAPHTQPQLRGAFLGLNLSHTRADLVQAVLEGVAFEIESIRQAAQAMTGAPINQLAVAGGGASNRRWMQLRADISGCRIHILPQSETTMLGAAIQAGLGCSFYENLQAAKAALMVEEGVIFEPEPAVYALYREKFFGWLEMLSKYSMKAQS